MVFCNEDVEYLMENEEECHNPYFNRWFSAIATVYHKNYYGNGHNPYFNRWFSAIAY